jgi:hypothetical protein
MFSLSAASEKRASDDSMWSEMRAKEEREEILRYY